MLSENTAQPQRERDERGWSTRKPSFLPDLSRSRPSPPRHVSSGLPSGSLETTVTGWDERLPRRLWGARVPWTDGSGRWRSAWWAAGSQRTGSSAGEPPSWSRLTLGNPSPSPSPWFERDHLSTANSRGRGISNLAAELYLTQISAYITHENLAVRKIVEAMRTAYAKHGTRSQHVSKQNLTQTRDHWTYPSMWKESVHRLRRTFYFVESFDELSSKGALLKCGICFSISFRWYAFPNFCTQISRPCTCVRWTHRPKS